MKKNSRELEFALKVLRFDHLIGYDSTASVGSSSWLDCWSVMPKAVGLNPTPYITRPLCWDTRSISLPKF